MRLVTDGLRDYPERRNAAARSGWERPSGWNGWDVHVSGPPGLVPEITGLLLELGADPALIRHDPAPATFNRARPLSASDWFLDERDVPWINRTDLGGPEE